MDVEASVTIDAPADRVWSVATDIENAQNTISGIKDIEILDRSPGGLVGLKWKETRMMGNREAVETMWVTEAEKGSYYVTEARSHGSIYRTRIILSESDGRTSLRMAFSTEPVSLLAKIFTVLLGPVMKRSIRKAFHDDLQDIKAAAESQRAAG